MADGQLRKIGSKAIGSVLSLLAVMASSPVLAQQGSPDNPQIVVTGNRAVQAEITADLSKSITLHPPTGKPLPKHYDPVCVKIFGLDPAYAEVLAERVMDNLATLKIPLKRQQCQPNSWVGFVTDSHDAVIRLRKEEPQMFAELHQYEIDRVLAGNQAAQAWHATQAKGVDGKPFRWATIQIGGVEKEVQVNDQWQAGRTISPIRFDMIGSIVLFDRALSAGRTIQQLADYATFRLLAPVRDLEEGGTDQPQSILTLFSGSATAPPGLTEFDWGYLAGYYKLGEGATAANVHDAAKRSYLDGIGQKLLERVVAAE